MKTQLPPRPSLEQLKKQAKAFLKNWRAEDPAGSRMTLADAQLAIAREYGFESWPKLKRDLLLKQADTQRVEAGNTLREAAGKGDLDRLKALLDEHPDLVNDAGGEGVRTALHRAVFGAQSEAIRLLLERGADPNIRCEGDNAYPLHFAAEKQNFPIVRLLIEHGTDPIGEGDYHELGVLGWATAWESIEAKPEIIEYLQANGARHNIFSATATGAVEDIKRLVTASRENLERRMDMGNRRRKPLHLAVIKRQLGSLDVLLDLGAQIESLDESGFSALDQAALIGERAMAQMLLDRGAKVRLPAALALGRQDDVERWLRRDPDCLKPAGRWENLIVRVSERGPGELVERLIDAGASVNVHDNPKTSVDSTSRYTPLHAAAFRGNMSAAKMLIEHGANVRTRDGKYHGTPAGWASYAGHTAVRDRILQEPVDIMEAVEYGLVGRVLQIIAEDPKAIDKKFERYDVYPMYAEGWFTPLDFAAALGKTEIVEILKAPRAKSTPAGEESRE